MNWRQWAKRNEKDKQIIQAGQEVKKKLKFSLKTVLISTIT